MRDRSIFSRSVISVPTFFLIASALLAGCTPSRYQHAQDFTPAPIADIEKLQEPVPRAEAKSVMGNPKRYTVLGKEYQVMSSADGYRARGIASWYGMKFHGHQTSNGEIYDVYQFTAAHKTLPLPSYVRVTRLDNQKSVVVRVNDRGPFHEGRIIDLSYAAAVKLGIQKQGTAEVQVDVIHPPINKSERWVQVGALSDPSAAQKLQQQLSAELGASTKVSIKTVQQSQQLTLHKVRIGPVEEGEPLQTLLQQLQALNINQPLLLGRHQL
ncbi:septal ring lytic transglycosylase RlpA family protein [Bacterioplanoides sp.]|uniref:septal ring lytic transglycosylase RlpA family protein n=1 Tax=Bacterioplanoides sp. TaxID=2066072 RepID=UPI003B001593